MFINKTSTSAITWFNLFAATDRFIYYEYLFIIYYVFITGWRSPKKYILGRPRCVAKQWFNFQEVIAYRMCRSMLLILILLIMLLILLKITVTVKSLIFICFWKNNHSLRGKFSKMARVSVESSCLTNHETINSLEWKLHPINIHSINKHLRLQFVRDLILGDEMCDRPGWMDKWIERYKLLSMVAPW